MYLEVMPNGSKYWRLEYRIGGKEKRAALGVSPAVSQLAACKARDSMKEALRAGLDPTHEKRREKSERSVARANSFEGMPREWHAGKVESSAEGYAANVLK